MLRRLRGIIMSMILLIVMTKYEQQRVDPEITVPTLIIVAVTVDVLTPFRTAIPLELELTSDSTLKLESVSESDSGSDSAKTNDKKDKKKKKKNYLSLSEVKENLSLDMDISKPSGLSKSDFIKLVKNMKYDYTGVFERNAGYIWKLAQEFQFNEIAFLGIIALESQWGSSEGALKTNNYTSQMKQGKLIPYETEKDCFEATAKNLGNNYLKKTGKYYSGKTLFDVNKTYCEPNEQLIDGKKVYVYTWYQKVYQCMKMIVG